MDVTSSSGLVLGERNISNSTNIYLKSRVENIHSIISDNEILPFTNTLTTTSDDIVKYGKSYGGLSEMVDECFVDYSMYSSDTVSSYDYTLTYDNSIKSILNKTQNELIATKEELVNTKKELEHTKYELSQRSNPNLLINGDFQVWQRGDSFDMLKISLNPYTADRWRYVGVHDNENFTVLRSTDGIRITNNVGGYRGITQLFENPSIFNNKIITISAKVKIIDLSPDGSIGLQIRQNLTWNHAGVHATKHGEYIIKRTEKLKGDLTDFAIGIQYNNSRGDMIVEWVKVEFGEHATPFVPRNYGEELLLSQRYYQIHSTNTIPEIDLRPNMRVTPTITTISGGYSYDAEIY